LIRLYTIYFVNKFRVNTPNGRLRDTYLYNIFGTRSRASPPVLTTNTAKYRFLFHDHLKILDRVSKYYLKRYNVCRLNYCLLNQVRRTVIISVQRRTRKTYNNMLLHHIIIIVEMKNILQNDKTPNNDVILPASRSAQIFRRSSPTVIRITPRTEPVNSHRGTRIN